MHLTDLDDDCLLNVFSFLAPLPDLISLSKACRRFHSLTGDGRMRLLVLAPGRVDGPVSPQMIRAAASARNCRHAYDSLLSAVQGSRPGDKIVLEPGEHAVRDIRVSWPLHLVGGGGCAEDTLLDSPDSASGAFIFRASGKLANLTIRSTAASCITHMQGHLTVEGCSLSCKGTGLKHLFSPIVTRASRSRPAHWLPSTEAPGVLKVVETKIRGGRGSSACRAEGTGELRDVRIINLHHDTLFWFRVDSEVPGHIWHSMPWAAASYRRAQSREPDSTSMLKQEAGPAAAEPGQLQPSWADSPASPAVAVLEQRAKAWSLAQRFSSATELQEDHTPEPVHKRQRRH
ncbi:hypothetical protein CVIRNUC_000602 [Coccomyxa viridis]|uniref:F-box domain-containing protein n=1 Tax=Coccomyxa viridis TaxID=1274662 RepID=A0AAV1HTK4_9CHLO|nr:hypothetical protein CVIRNUC_000602 [Coccomyxa viridis]